MVKVFKSSASHDNITGAEIQVISKDTFGSENIQNTFWWLFTKLAPKLNTDKEFKAGAS